jgi:hypothetical protein
MTGLEPMHIGEMLKLRRVNNGYDKGVLARVAGISIRRLLEIEKTGVATPKEVDNILKAMERKAYINAVAPSLDIIQEQAHIITLLKESLAQRLKNKVRADLIQVVFDYMDDVCTESEYLGMMCSRIGAEEIVLDKVKKRRTIK